MFDDMTQKRRISYSSTTHYITTTSLPCSVNKSWAYEATWLRRRRRKYERVRNYIVLNDFRRFELHFWPRAIFGGYAVLQNHGLYGSTSCCISHGPYQWERAIFDPPTVPKLLNRFSWNLKYITTSRTRPRMQNFRGLCQRGWSGQIASLTHESFCPFFPFLSEEPR